MAAIDQRQRIQALRLVLSNKNLRLLVLSWGVWVTGEWAVLVTLSVVAYAQGGPQAVGLVGAARALPAVLAPVDAALTDRFARERVLAALHATWAVALLALGITAALGLPLYVTITIVAVEAGVSAGFKPAVAALAPQLVDRVEELTAANSACSTMESVGTVAGPILASGLLAIAVPPLVLVVLALPYAAAALFALRIQTAFRAARSAGTRRGAGAGRLRRVAIELGSGFHWLLDQPRSRLTAALISGQAIVRGLLNVFLLVVAVTLLGLGEAGVGVLFALVGAGGVVGSIIGLGLGVGRRLGTPFCLGVGVWGLSVLAIGLWPLPVVSACMLAALGVGNAIEDIAGVTLLQRGTPTHALGRTFGAYAGLIAVAIALGSVIAPLLISTVGVRWAMVTSGGLLALAAGLGWTRMRRLDHDPDLPSGSIALLRAQPMFAPLSSMTIEGLAGALQTLGTVAGDVVVRQGDPGDRFYLIERGSFVVLVDGRTVNHLGPGDAFGEVALLRTDRRTATVSALDEGRLLWLDAEAFTPAVSGHTGSWEAATSVIDTHQKRSRLR